MNNRPIRVAQIIGMAIDGGVESCIMNYYRNIDRSKVQFDFFVESTSKIINQDKIEAMGGRIIFIPSYKNPFKYMRILSAIFKANRYDIVHSNMNALSVFALRAAKKAGIKIRIAHSHSTSNPKERLRTFVKNLLKPFSKKYATHYFACGEKAGRWLFGDKTFDSGKVHIINNAIELDKFKFNVDTRQKMRQQLEIENKFVVGHIGRFMTQKNHEFLVGIFYEIQKINPDSVLLLVGDGPLHEEIVEKTRQLKINHKVIFAGIHKHTNRYYDSMDCFVLPSLYEGLPVVSIEAQINGLDCFFSNNVTNEVGINDNVEFISLEKSAKEWAEKIVSKSNNMHSNDVRLGYSNFFIGTKYDIKNEANKLLDIYLNFYSNICSNNEQGR